VEFFWRALQAWLLLNQPWHKSRPLKINPIKRKNLTLQMRAAQLS
jgi:hypothetical protein